MPMIVDSQGNLVQPANTRRLLVRWSGRLFANNADSKFLVRLNGDSNGYQSFVVMDGHHGAGEWDMNGFYIGRNGWYLDADVSLEYVIEARTGRKRTGYGHATFALSNNNILGYAAHGFWANAAAPIQTVDIYLEGNGTANGDLTVQWV